MVLLLAGAALLALGLFSGSVLIAAPVGHTASLWYVLLVAGVLGTIGAAARLDTPAR